MSLDTPNGACPLHVLAAVAIEQSPSRTPAQINVPGSNASSSIIQNLSIDVTLQNGELRSSDLIPTVCGNQNCRRTISVFV